MAKCIGRNLKMMQKEHSQIYNHHHRHIPEHFRCILSYNLSTILNMEYYYFPCFTDKETKTQMN